MGVLHPRVDTAPGPSMTPLRRELTGNAEGSDKAKHPGILSVGTAGFMISSSCWTCLPLVSWFGHAPSDGQLISGASSSKFIKCRYQISRDNLDLRGQETSGYKA